MPTFFRFLAALIILFAIPEQSRAVQLTLTRDALQRTLRQQLFSGPNGRYYLKGNPQSPCSIYAEAPGLTFEQDRIVVRMKTHARLGHPVAGACVGLALSLPAQVSLAPDANGETIGFRDARLDKVSDLNEINFVLSPFLRRQVPSSMKVNVTLPPQNVSLSELF